MRDGATTPGAVQAPPSPDPGRPARTRGGGRDARIDVMRGGFLIGMAAGHLLGAGAVARGYADAPFLHQVTHPFIWFDAAIGFVFFSGLVSGMVLRRRTDTGGEAVAHRWLWRRSLMLYGAHVALALAAVVATTWRAGESRLDIPTIGELGGPVPAVAKVLTLAEQPDQFNILPLYVVFLLGCMGAVWLMVRGRTWVVLAVSTAGYVAAQTFVDDTTDGPLDGPFIFYWLAWQWLFVGAFVLGWHLKTRVRPALAPWRVPLLAATFVVTAALLTAAHLHAAYPGRWAALDEWSAEFRKYWLTPASVLYFGCASFVLLALLGWARRIGVGRAVTDPFALIGRHSLGCFVTMLTVQVLALSVFRPDWPLAQRGQDLLLVVVALFLVVAWWAERPRRAA